MKPHSIQPDALPKFTPPPRNYVRTQRVAIWNAAFIIAGLLLIALAGEVYLRLANPFLEHSISSQFVDGVGRIREPNAELLYANWHDDNFVVSRANSLGFLDREPVSPERAAASCHIAFIGDSFVEAREAHISEKFHVRMEEMAARQLPRLNIATQAYGIGRTGQIHQLPFYDEYARLLNPKFVVLVFSTNDFSDNSTLLHSLAYGIDPDRLPFMSAHKDANGVLKLRPPDPEFGRFLLPRLPTPWHRQAWQRLIRVSYFAKWVDTKDFLWSYDNRPQVKAWLDIIAERPCCASLLDGQLPADWANAFERIERLPPILEEAMEYTAFGIEQFKRRANRDNATLAILPVAPQMGTQGDPQFDRLNAIAEARGIPIINNYDYIVRRGHAPEDARWSHDPHWNPTGHQWAAEAVLEWLKENQEGCG